MAKTKKTNPVKKTSSAPEPTGRLRSPNYPAIGLRKAVDTVRLLVEKDGKAGAPMEIAFKHMGFNSGHGYARAVVSALRKFNLVELDGAGRVTPTDDALAITRFPDGHPRKVQSLRTAALSPAIYKQILQSYVARGELPSDESLRPEIEMDWNFNPKAIPDFLTDFRDTLTFAGLLAGNLLLLEGVAVVESDTPEAVGGEDRSMPVVVNPQTAPLNLTTYAPEVIIKPAVKPPVVPTPPTPSPTTGPIFNFTFGDGNSVEIRMRKKVTAEEFEKVKKIFVLSEMTFVEEAPADLQPKQGDDSLQSEATVHRRLILDPIEPTV